VHFMAWSLPDGCVLGIFGKKPEAGRVKTRLATAFGPEAAAEMHEAMLFDLIATWGSDTLLDPGGRRVLVFSPGDAGPWFDARVPASFVLQPQVEGDLGRRMQAFFASEFEDGATHVVLIGSDAPTLDPTIVFSAFLCLEGRDVVLGPAADGGYYQVGSRRAPPPIFDRVDWSTPEVLGQTMERLRDTGLSRHRPKPAPIGRIQVDNSQHQARTS
jgi:rSAM/selenodomain-associated transferase 1